jgi:hypothetical protein
MPDGYTPPTPVVAQVTPKMIGSALDKGAYNKKQRATPTPQILNNLR